MLSFFGFKTACPVTLEEQVWIERRMCWLQNQRGLERIQKASPGVYSAADFPELQGLDRESVMSVFERLRAIISVTHPVRLEVESPATAGDVVSLAVEPGRVIKLQEQLLKDPAKAVAVMTRELSREWLRSENRIRGNEPDLEPLLDLATVCFGFGLFGANANHQSKPDKGSGSNQWMMNRVRGLNAFQFGYALAVYCWLRHEAPGEWQQELRRDARDSLTQGMKFLKKSEISQVFEPRPADSSIYLVWERRLKSKNDVLVLDALWDMNAYEQPLPASLVPFILLQTHHAETSIGKGALDLFLSHPHIAVQAERDLADCLSHSAVRIRFAALGALAKIPRSRDTQDALVHLLGKERDHSTRIRIVFLMVDQTAKMPPEEVVPVLLETMRESLLESNEQEITLLCKLLDRVSDDAENDIRSRFGHSEDDEWMGLALACLAESRKPADHQDDSEAAGSESAT